MNNMHNMKPANMLKTRFPKIKSDLTDIGETVAEILLCELSYEENDIANNEILVLNFGLFILTIDKSILSDDVISLRILMSIGTTSAALITKTLISYYRGYDIHIDMGYDYVVDDEGNIIEIVYEEDMEYEENFEEVNKENK